MGNEPPTDGALTVTFAFFFLIVQPAIACNEGLAFLKQEFELIDTGKGMIVVHPDTHLILWENCTMELVGDITLDDMKGPIDIEYDTQWDAYHLPSRKIKNVCDRVKSVDGKTKEKFHVLLDCFLSFAKFNDDCSIPAQKITHGSCDFSEYENKMKAAKIETKMKITNDDRTAIMKTIMHVGKKQEIESQV